MRSPSNHLAVLLLLLLGSLPPLLSLIFSFPLPPGNVSLASAIFPPAVIFPRNSATHGERLPFNGRGEIVPEPRPPHLDPAIPSDLNTKNKTNPNPRRFTGAEWWGMGVLAIVLIILTGLLAGLTLGVMSVDLTRLRVWSNTGSEDRRKQAKLILDIRKHPNWLLTSLILSSVAVAEGLPLLMNHLFQAGALKPFIASTILVAFVGELLPQAIMPIFIFAVVGKSMWFVHGVMWAMAPLSVPLGWGVRKFKQWNLKGKKVKVDGMLGKEELVEYIRLHEQGEGWGGEVDEEAGRVVRGLLEGQERRVGEAVVSWVGPVVLGVEENVDELLVERIKESKYPFAIVVRYELEESESGEEKRGGIIKGIVTKEAAASSDDSGGQLFVRDLNILPVPVVRDDCKLMSLVQHFQRADARAVLVVPRFQESSLQLDGAMISHLKHRSPSPEVSNDRETITLDAPSLVGVVTAATFWPKLFESMMGNNEKEATTTELGVHVDARSSNRESEPELIIPKKERTNGLRRRSARSKLKKSTVGGQLDGCEGTALYYNETTDLQRASGALSTDGIRAASESALYPTTAPPRDINVDGQQSLFLSRSTSARRAQSSRGSVPWADWPVKRLIVKHERFTDPTEDQEVAAILREAGFGGQCVDPV